MQSVHDSEPPANISADPESSSGAVSNERLAESSAEVDAGQSERVERFAHFARLLPKVIAYLTSVNSALSAVRPAGGGSPSESPRDVLDVPFALLSDGRVLLSTKDLDSLDLAGRAIFTGIVLTEAEVSFAMDRVVAAFEEIGAYSVGRLRKMNRDRGPHIP